MMAEWHRGWNNIAIHLVMDRPDMASHIAVGFEEDIHLVVDIAEVEVEVDIDNFLAEADMNSVPVGDNSNLGQRDFVRQYWALAEGLFLGQILRDHKAMDRLCKKSRGLESSIKLQR
jgi:hypothetical protein